LFFQVDKTKLYEFQIANARFDPVIKMLLRLYGGELFSEFVKISESYLAKGLKITEKEMIATLQHLNELKIVIYQPLKNKPQVTFVLPRQDADKLPLNINRLEERKKLIVDKMNAMVAFATTTHRCRMQIVQEYFGEDTFAVCGLCDVCIEQRKSDNRSAYDLLRAEIVTIIKSTSMTIEQLEEYIEPTDQELFTDVVRELVDEGLLQYDDSWRLQLSEQKN
jgi:ATP-dependent DNA helicase RecQ